MRNNVSIRWALALAESLQTFHLSMKVPYMEIKSSTKNLKTPKKHIAFLLKTVACPRKLHCIGKKTIRRSIDFKETLYAVLGFSCDFNSK